MKLTKLLGYVFMILITPATMILGQEEQKAPAFSLRADKLYKDLKCERNLVYKTVDGEELSMDLILPEKQMYVKGSPVLIYIHGGGWKGGERYVLHPNTLKRYTDKGIAIACISYRLVKGERTVEECIIDCKDAARFLAKNAAKYKLDPSRFGATGHSAGAHLSLLEALAPMNAFVGEKDLARFKPTFVCVAAYAAPTSFIDPNASGPKTLTSDPKFMKSMLGGSQEEKKDLATALSPLTYLKKNSPAILLVHGDADPLISVNGARLMEAQAKKIGATLTYYEVRTGDHTFKGDDVNYDGKFLDEARFNFVFEHLLKNIKLIGK